MKAFNKFHQILFGELVSSFSLTEKWVLEDPAGLANDPDERNHTGILTSGFEPGSRLPDRISTSGCGSL
jgi:hypothetical protein